MAMQRQLWTINGLATELGMDRRTLAKLLDGVAANGTLKGGRPGWHLNTALDLIADKNRGPRSAPASRKTARADAAILGNYIDRLENWRDLRSEPEVVLAIDELAEMLDVPRETVLVWLRAGRDETPKCSVPFRGVIEVKNVKKIIIRDLENLGEVARCDD